MKTRYIIQIDGLYLSDPAPDDTGISLTDNEHAALKFVTYERACHVAKVAALRSNYCPNVLSFDFDF